MPGKRAARDAGYKMVVVLRGELRLTAGKAAVQVAHAAVLLTLAGQSHRPEAVAAWLREGGKKIALVVPTLVDLEQLDRAARARGLPTVWVEDAGMTEVPAGTRTCLGIGPSAVAEVDAVTGALDLY